jgi:general secretion pathway protein L
MPTAEQTTATPRIRQRLGQVGGRLRPGLSGFWNWWAHALASWLPLRLRELFGLARERLLLQIAADSLRLTLERGDASRGLGQVPWSADTALDDPFAPLLDQRIADLPRWLVLPATSGLRRPMLLPSAAADRLRDVLAFEIDRQTPFSAADVQYDARVTGRRGDGQIELELVVVPTPTLQTALTALGPLARTLDGVDMLSGDGRTLGVNLLPGAQRHRRADPWLGWNLALAAVAVIAVAAAMWQMLANREASASAFEGEVAQLAQQARGVAAEKKQLVDLVEGLAFLQATRAGRPTTVEVLEELSRRLPDTTYLEKLSIENDRLLLIGLSSEASSLVRRMEDSSLWRSPALTGALQPDPRSGRDRFTLIAEIAIAQPENASVQREGDDARNQR